MWVIFKQLQSFDNPTRNLKIFNIEGKDLEGELMEFFKGFGEIMNIDSCKLSKDQ